MRGHYLRIGEPGDLFGWLEIPGQYHDWYIYFAEFLYQPVRLCREMDEEELRPNGDKAPVAVFPDLSPLIPPRDEVDGSGPMYLSHYFRGTPFHRVLMFLSSERICELIEAGMPPREMDLMICSIRHLREYLRAELRAAEVKTRALGIPAIVGALIALPYHELMSIVLNMGDFLSLLSHFGPDGLEPDFVLRRPEDTYPPKAVATIALDSRYRELVEAAGDAGIEFCDVVGLTEGFESLDRAWRSGVPVADLFV